MNNKYQKAIYILDKSDFEKLQKSLSGGYKQKYLKYKAKYIELKNKLSLN